MNTPMRRDSNLPNFFSRRPFLKTIGLAAIGIPFISSRLMAQSGRRVLRHASFGTGGMAWSDVTALAKHQAVQIVALCDVDTRRALKARRQFPEARFYQDWRKLLEQEAENIDSVNVSVPDHMHAPIALSAMQLGKHIYCQKPLAYSLHEVRRMSEYARERKLITQMGIQIHSTGYYRMAKRLVQDGTIGKIKEVHCWCEKSWGDPETRPKRSDSVPPELDWDMWLGVASERPFLGEEYYHPFNWRKRLDFGTGTFGDMGCHIFDPVFQALSLTTPVSVRSEGPSPNQWNWALDSEIHYTFSGTQFTAETSLPVHWYDGKASPPQKLKPLIEGDDFPPTGSLFIGTAGVMLLPHWARPQLYPDSKFAAFEYPNVEAADHYGQFVEACLGNAKTTANFDYAGPLTEAVLLGGVASRFPQTTMKWDVRKMRFDLGAANQFVRREYRRGWKLPV